MEQVLTQCRGKTVKSIEKLWDTKSAGLYREYQINFTDGTNIRFKGNSGAHVEAYYNKE